MWARTSAHQSRLPTRSPDTHSLTGSFESKRAGFTIVELLIVVVVIGVVASITVVAYTGIANQANDVAVRSDLRQIGEQLRYENAHTGAYPVFNGSTQGPGFKFAVSRNAYFDTGYNLYICQSSTDPQSGFVIVARSKAGNVHAWSSAGGFVSYGGSFTTSSAICPAAGYESFNFTYGRNNTGNWAGWTAG